jgi:hypothetical protein
MKLKIIQTFLRANFWVILFALICFGILEQGLKQLENTHDMLVARRSELQTAKQQALATRQDLILRLNSESDPAWIELLLMYGLGVVPEDQTKIFFTKTEKGIK